MATIEDTVREQVLDVGRMMSDAVDAFDSEHLGSLDWETITDNLRAVRSKLEPIIVRCDTINDALNIE